MATTTDSAAVSSAPIIPDATQLVRHALKLQKEQLEREQGKLRSALCDLVTSYLSLTEFCQGVKGKLKILGRIPRTPVYDEFRAAGYHIRELFTIKGKKVPEHLELLIALDPIERLFMIRRLGRYRWDTSSSDSSSSSSSPCCSCAESSSSDYSSDSSSSRSSSPSDLDVNAATIPISVPAPCLVPQPPLYCTTCGIPNYQPHCPQANGSASC